MGLLTGTRSGRAPKARPVRTARPRVRLSPEEIKLTARLKPIERRIAWILAALTAVGITIAELDVGVQPLRLGGGLLSAALLAWAARGRSRFLVGIAAMSAAFFWPMKYAVAAYPSLVFMMFLMLRMSSDRRKAMDARIARGDTDLPGTQSRTPRKKRKGGDDTTGATGADGATTTSRPVAAASKRYTPPKHRPARGRR
jgi:hypothetical protein